MKTYVLVIRDPDDSNEFVVDSPAGHTVETFDMDLGRGWEISKIGGEAHGELRDELLEWADTWTEQAAGVPDGSPVRARILSIVREVLDRAGFTDAEVQRHSSIPKE